MKKYLLLIPLVICLISLVFFSSAYKELENEKLEQKFYDVKHSIELVVLNINSLTSEEFKNHQELIENGVSYIDTEYMVTAVIYTADLECLSNRTVTNDEFLFYPLEHDEFITAVKNNDSGELTIPYDDGIHEYNEETLYYKWAYTEDGRDKYLLTIGISLYSTIDNYAAWISIGTVILIISLIFMQILMVIQVSKLADVERDLNKKMKKVN